MNKILFLVAVFFVSMPQVLFAQERMVSFDADIAIGADATVHITETITYDFGEDQRHGIFRTIPVKYKTDAGNTRSIRVRDISVVNEQGNAHTFTTSKEGRNLKIKIGDADQYVSGEHVYQITYLVEGALNYFDAHDELYWNVTGHAWEVPMGQVSVSLAAPDIEKTECFVGAFGSTQKCVQSSAEAGSVQFSHASLGAGEGMTIVVGVPKGLITPMSPWARLWWFLQDNWLTVGLPLLVIGGIVRHWWRKGRDPRGTGVIVPQWELPDNLSPAELGVVIDERFDKQDLAALIINLAVQGHLTITHIADNGIFSSDDYELTKKTSDHPLTSFEEEFMQDFFGSAKTVKISDKKQKFHKTFSAIADDLYTRLTPQYFVKNPKNVATTYVGIGMALLFVLHVVGIIMGNVVVIVSGWVIGLGLIFGLGKIMIRKTVDGVRVYEQVKGLKVYLETAEKRQMEYLNAPEKNVQQFEKLLPAAVALGVVKEWGEQFEDLLDKEPQWFDGGTQAFSASHFGASMAGFSTAAGSTLSSKPASASSGSSGFSGGGSGGGFGGGGGGSW